MAPGVLREALRQTPFRPFRIVQTDGTSYDVRHPDQVWVAQTYAIVGVYGDQPSQFAERHLTLDLLHLIRLEPLPQPAQGNGQQG
jgi:hypothetical protein